MVEKKSFLRPRCEIAVKNAAYNRARTVVKLKEFNIDTIWNCSFIEALVPLCKYTIHIDNPKTNDTLAPTFKYLYRPNYDT